MNNLSIIREIYGATQSEIAHAVGINRVTLANWEIGNSRPSNPNIEKLSLYYGIGPEYFFDRSVDGIPRQMVVDAGNRERKMTMGTGGRRNKAQELRRLFEETTFNDTLSMYVRAVKMLLAKVDEAQLEDLQSALLINRKLAERMEAAVEIKKHENESPEPTLQELLEQLCSEIK